MIQSKVKLSYAGNLMRCVDIISVADIDPYGSALILVGWIRIQEGINELKIQTSEGIYFLRAGYSLLRAEGFSCNLEDVLHGGLGIKKIAFFYLKHWIFFRCKILQFLVIKTLDPDLELDPDPRGNQSGSTTPAINQRLVAIETIGSNPTKNRYWPTYAKNW
jgi:hypothetical protein